MTTDDAVTTATHDIALSLWPTWAWLVVNRFKPIENRRWSTRVRGPILIHAAKQGDATEYADAVAFAKRINPTIVVPPKDELPRGGIVGRATLVDIIPPCMPAHAMFKEPCACGTDWHIGTQYGFVLRDAEPLPFRPRRGLQRWFRVPRSAS